MPEQIDESLNTQSGKPAALPLNFKIGSNVFFFSILLDLIVYLALPAIFAINYSDLVTLILLGDVLLIATEYQMRVNKKLEWRKFYKIFVWIPVIIITIIAYRINLHPHAILADIIILSSAFNVGMKIGAVYYFQQGDVTEYLTAKRD